jgi:hypothetical protein
LARRYEVLCIVVEKANISCSCCVAVTTTQLSQAEHGTSLSPSLGGVLGAQIKPDPSAFLGCGGTSARAVAAAAAVTGRFSVISGRRPGGTLVAWRGDLMSGALVGCRRAPPREICPRGVPSTPYFVLRTQEPGQMGDAWCLLGFERGS